MAEDEPRYTPTELWDMYLEFMHQKDVRERLNKDEIHWWEHTELTIRFITYVRFYDHELRMREIDAELQRLQELAERRKSRLFGEPTDGLLFKEE